MRTIEASLTWPDGSAIRATLGLLAPELGARLDWIGDAAKLAELPPEIAPGAGAEDCDIGTILTFGKLHALEKGASFAWASSGSYDTWAE